MGTRGLYGFKKGGVTKATYNHFDSYPSGLGVDLLQEIRGFERKHLEAAFKRIKLVDDSDKPTVAQRKRYASVCPGMVDRDVTDWYTLLRNFQGSLLPWISGEVRWTESNYVNGQFVRTRYEVTLAKGPAIHMIDSADFLKDGLFCEWAYLVNLDSGALEVYRSGEMVEAFPLEDLPRDDDFTRILEGDDSEEAEPEPSKACAHQTGACNRVKAFCGSDVKVDRVLADLRHYCEVQRLDFAKISARATRIYKGEVAEDKRSATAKLRKAPTRKLSAV